ncbi:helix-turn-helix domain-containing protein [Aliiroseovarius zhejiangensis]|uniref:Helix-turn-helix domain-containing protein n=1 Tax=Aliiroseovarius zhejiangensis TaxID=1632025 RepID=A0ABQ3IN46_9RHOB|nr:helix-turn-helix domain-containing protein [Aliiroseovarius zhejiangensis]GHE88469.1 helix-turn-helix domain-containing protein [Aliiroseovarius zhejiangensis]
MSHKATHWLAGIEPARLTHGEFRVLFHLCDCHNPSQGCFPKQAYLRDKTGLSNGGLNNALAALEEKRLILREKTYDKAKKKRGPTHYILGCDEDLTQDLTPLNGDSPNSTFQPNLTPLSGQTYLHSGGVSIKEEPVKEPVKEPCVSQGATHTGFDFQNFLDRFMAIYPRGGDPEATEDAMKAALDGGADPDHILAAARAYADEQKGNKPQYLAYSENWLRDERWKRHSAPKPAATEDDVLAKLAEAIKARMPWVATTTSAAKARDLIRRGLVTEAECKAAGVL